MKKLIIILSILLVSVTSCKKNLEKKSKIVKNEVSQPLMKYEDLISDYKNWWSYHYNEISLASDFEAMNENSDKISKEEFLKTLTTGNFIVIEMQSGDASKIYKLFELLKDADEGISSTIQQTSITAYKHFKMEGTAFPDFEVVDVNGNEYNNEQLKGKSTLIKTWFINCKPCIAEMPELNAFVEKHKKSKNMQFLSLAKDTKPELLDFLQKQEFEYAVIAEQRELIQGKLNIKASPTHLVVDENGNIEKVFNKASELIAYIDKVDDVKSSQQNKSLQPPPAPHNSPSSE